MAEIRSVIEKNLKEEQTNKEEELESLTGSSAFFEAKKSTLDDLKKEIHSVETNSKFGIVMNKYYFTKESQDAALKKLENFKELLEKEKAIQLTLKDIQEKLDGLDGEMKKKESIGIEEMKRCLKQMKEGNPRI